jgi:hypothetical protein
MASWSSLSTTAWPSSHSGVAAGPGGPAAAGPPAIGGLVDVCASQARHARLVKPVNHPPRPPSRLRRAPQ